MCHQFGSKITRLLDSVEIYWQNMDVTVDISSQLDGDLSLFIVASTVHTQCN